MEPDANSVVKNRYDAVMSQIHASPIRGGGGFAQLDEARLTSVESRIGFPLPADYREFLSKYGFTAGTGDVRFRDAESEIESSVGAFYGVDPEHRADLVGMKEGFGDRLPAWILPVASSAGGLFCLSLAGEDLGSIFWWSPHRGSPDPLDDLELVAPSFDAFINSLIVVPESDG